MEGVHEMAAEIFVRLMSARAAQGGGQPDAAEIARASYAYARAFFDEHGRHLERGA